MSGDFGGGDGELGGPRTGSHVLDVDMERGHDNSAYALKMQEIVMNIIMAVFSFSINYSTISLSLFYFLLFFTN